MPKLKLMAIRPGFRRESWEIIGEPYRDGKRTFAEARCRCGTVKRLDLWQLMHGQANSCGCARRLSVGVGEPFGLWEVVGPVERPAGQSVVRCRCTCGVERPVRVAYLLDGRSTGCGCERDRRTAARSTTHGDTAGAKRHPLYTIWCAMKTRCTNPRIGGWKDYGGRGIRMCPEWAGYVPFKAWAVANGYREGLSIERKDVNGNYEPGNVEWIPFVSQARNRTDSIRLTAFGETKSIHDWAEDPRAKVKATTMRGRIERGWPPEEVVTAPRTNRYLRAKRAG